MIRGWVRASCLSPGGPAGERRQAQAALAPFSTNSECISQCQFILDHSTKPFALLLAGSSLLRLITQFWNAFTVDQTVDMRNYLLNWLATNCQKDLPPFVFAALIQVCGYLECPSYSSDTSRTGRLPDGETWMASCISPRYRYGHRQVPGVFAFPLHSWATAAYRAG